MPIKFNFTKSDGVSLNKGEIQVSGLNSHVLVPKGSTIDFKSLLIENLTPDITIIKDFEERVTDIHDVISDMKNWMEDPTQLTAIINTAIDGSHYSSVVEEVSTYADSTKSAAWYGLSMVTGENDQKWVTGFEMGSVTTNTANGGSVNENFFYVHSDNFIIGKALNIMDAETTTDASRTITYDLFDNNNNVIGARTLEVPYATLWDIGRYEDDYPVQQDNAVLYPLPALMVQWDENAKNYYIGFNGRVEFNSIYHKGTTIIEGGSIETQTIKSSLINADKVVIGANTSARHFGNFPQYFDANKVKLSTSSGAAYTITDPSGNIGNISWMTIYYPTATLREGDTYFDVPKGSNYVYNGISWVSTTGTTTYIQYIFKEFSRGTSNISAPISTDATVNTASGAITANNGWSIDAIAPAYSSNNQLYSSFATVTISKTTANGQVEDSYAIGSWSIPVAFNTEAPIYGTDFQDGVNGPYTSYVYYNVDRAADAPTKPTGGSYTGNPATEDMPTSNNVTWTDNPDINTTEDTYMSYVVYTHALKPGESTKDPGTWTQVGDWSTPVLYAKVPLKGQDYSDSAGNFHATVYRVVNKANATNWTSLLPSSAAKYTVAGGVTNLGNDGWADEPTTVDLATQFLVMSTGMFIQPLSGGVASATGAWDFSGSWSAPIKTTIEKGVDYYDGSTGDFISFVYKDSATQPGTPTDGSFNGIQEYPPTLPSDWSDNPPPNPVNIIWVSKRRYKAPANNASGYWTVASDWSEPSIYYQRGQDGSAITINLTNDKDIVLMTSYSGTFIGSAPSTTVAIYDGITPISNNFIITTLPASPAVTINDGFSISVAASAITTKDTDIKITATGKTGTQYEGKTLTKSFKVTALIDATIYELEPQESVIMRDPAGTVISGTTVSTKVRKTTAGGVLSYSTDITPKLVLTTPTGTNITTQVTRTGDTYSATIPINYTYDTLDWSVTFTFNGTNFTDIETIPLINQNGSPWTAELDNEYSGIPADSAGNVATDWLDGDVNTTCSLYLGTEPQEFTIAVGVVDGGTAKISTTNSKNVYIDAITADQCTIPIIFKYDNISVATKVFTVVKQKQGAAGTVYQLSFNKQVIACDKDGHPATTSITVSLASIDSANNATTLANVPAGCTLKYYKDATEIKAISANGQITVFTIATTTDTLTIGTIFKAVLTKGTTILDQESASVVLNGAPGAPSTIAGARGAITAYIDILGDSTSTGAFYFTHYRKTGTNTWVSLDSTGDCLLSRSEIFALVIPKDGLYYRKGDTVVCQQYVRSISSDGNTGCTDGTYPRKSILYALSSPSAEFSMVIPADATSLTNLLTDVKLWVHGDAIINNTLSVNKLIVGDGTSDNEVVISDGKLTAKNIVANSINLTTANVTGTLSAGSIVSGSISNTFLISFTSQDTQLNGDFPRGTNDNEYPYFNTLISYYYNGVLQNTFTAPQYHTKATIMATIGSFGVSTGDESLIFTLYIVDSTTAITTIIGNRARTGTTVLGDIIFLGSVDIVAGHVYFFKVEYNYGNWNKWEDQWFSVNTLITTYR